jgi:hypothetical protein
MTSAIPSPALNTGIPYSDCTLQTCPISQAQLVSDPTLVGNVIFLAIFGLCLVFQVIAGIYYRTWGYFAGIFCSLVLEIIGYTGRVQMHFNPFPDTPFMM